MAFPVDALDVEVFVTEVFGGEDFGSEDFSGEDLDVEGEDLETKGFDDEDFDDEVLDDGLADAVLLVAPFTGARAAEAATRAALGFRFAGSADFFASVAGLDADSAGTLARPLFATFLVALSDALGSAAFLLSGMAHSLTGSPVCEPRRVGPGAVKHPRTSAGRSSRGDPRHVR